MEPTNALPYKIFAHRGNAMMIQDERDSYALPAESWQFFDLEDERRPTAENPPPTPELARIPPASAFEGRRSLTERGERFI
jgi:hypothetical protein